MMSDIRISIFDRFPAEVFYRIFDHLSTREIFDIFYNLCQRLNAFVIGYNRYKLDFSSISRSDFDFYISIIRPRNIISLILSDDDQTPGQIGLFLSLFNIEEFRRVRSLSLLQIEERNLIVFLQQVFIHNLKSLIIRWRGGLRFHGYASEIHKLLSSIISQPNLRYLDLSLWIYEIKNLSWSNDCFLQYLCIDDCSFSEYCIILDSSPHLKTFLLRNGLMHDIDRTFSSSSFVRPSYYQLRSLSLDNLRNIHMETLTSLLSVTPSLVYLKLIGSGHLRDDVFDGTQWENFIENDLIFLEKFQFFFTTKGYGNQTADNVLSLIIPFSLHFWKEKKRWFVRSEFIKSLSQIRLYSIPICQSNFEYICESDIISRSTLIAMNDDVKRVNGIRTVSMNLQATTIEEEVCFNNDQRFFFLCCLSFRTIRI